MRVYPPGEPLRALSEIDAPEGESDDMVRVTTARVALADHALLAHDMPALSDAVLTASGRDPDLCRERWLLEQAGLVSVAQAAQAVANSPIRASGEPRDAWRPPRYGRAVVVAAHCDGGHGPSSLLLDVKGAGRGSGQEPGVAHHSSGLCSLREALREWLFEAAIAAIFTRAAPDLWTLPVYGVIELGFDVKTHRGERLPAGLLVRRAHRRNPDDVTLPWRGSSDERLRLEIELLLRCYGLTSSNAGTRFRLREEGSHVRIAYRDASLASVDKAVEPAARALLGDAGETFCDGTNVQLARIEAGPDLRAQLVDFGHYEVRRRFEPALVSLVRDAPHLWGASIGPDDPRFVRPNPALFAPFARWARDEGGPRPEGAPRALVDPPTRWAHEAALAFRADGTLGSRLAEAIGEVRAAFAR